MNLKLSEIQNFVQAIKIQLQLRRPTTKKMMHMMKILNMMVSTTKKTILKQRS